MGKKRFLSILPSLVFPAFILAIIILGILFRRELWNFFSSPEKLKLWIEGKGAAAPFIFVALQFFQVVIFIIPGEVPQIAGGYLFGIWLGLLYSLVGITIGSSFNFFIARILGKPFILRFVKEEKLKKFDAVLTSPKAKAAMFLFFVIPGIPKDILCYVAGLSPLNFLSFFVISTTGRLPALFGSVIMGDAAAGQRWILLIVIVTIAIVLFFIGFFLREKIHMLIERITGKEKKTEKDDPNP